MTNLIRTEWLKLKKYKAFWWMTGIVLLSYPGVNFLFYKFYTQQLNDDKGMGPILKMIPNPFAFPDAWQTVAYLSSWFIFIPSVVVIMFITNEYTFKTHRQNIIDGWSRTQFMVAKMIDVLIISLLITVVYFILTLVIGSVNNAQNAGNALTNAHYTGLFFLQTFSQLSLAFLLAMVVRKSFIALGIFLVYFIIVEPVIVGIGRNFWHDAGRFMPLEISDRLIPLPRFLIRNEDAWKTMMQQQNIHLLYTVLLLLLTWGFCFWLNKRRDL